MPKFVRAPKQDFLALARALEAIPPGFTFHLGTGKDRPSEPFYGVQLIHCGEVIAEAEHDDGAQCVRMAIAQVTQ